MAWIKKDVQTTFIQQINNGGEQGQKPIEQREMESKFSDDPITTMIGDHVAINDSTEGYVLKIDTVKVEILSKFNAVLIKTSKAMNKLQVFDSPYILQFNIALLDGEPINVSMPINTDDIEEAKKQAMAYLKLFASDLANDALKLLIELNNSTDE